MGPRQPLPIPLWFKTVLCPSIESLTFPQAREWVNTWAQRSARSAKQRNEWVVRANEEMDERLAAIFGCSEPWCFPLNPIRLLPSFGFSPISACSTIFSMLLFPLCCLFRPLHLFSFIFSRACFYSSFCLRCLTIFWPFFCYQFIVSGLIEKTTFLVIF